MEMDLKKTCENILGDDKPISEVEKVLQVKDINLLQFSYRGSQPITYKVRQQPVVEEEEPGSSKWRPETNDPLDLMKPDKENLPIRRKKVSGPWPSRQEKVYTDILKTRKKKKIQFHRVAKMNAAKARKEGRPRWEVYLRECLQLADYEENRERRINTIYNNLQEYKHLKFAFLDSCRVID